MRRTFPPLNAISIVMDFEDANGAKIDFVVSGYTAGAALSDASKGEVLCTIVKRDTGAVATTDTGGPPSALQNMPMYCGTITTNAVLTIAEGVAVGTYLVVAWYCKKTGGVVVLQERAKVEFDVVPDIQTVAPPEP